MARSTVLAFCLLRSPFSPIRLKDGERRSETSYREQIAVLQAMLHTATTQLELANSDSVGHAKKVEELECEKEASKVKFKDMNIENQVLKRKINVLVPEDGLAKLPRPGPSLKPFEDLTPRQRRIASHDLQAKILNTSKERKIHPTMLSSSMTYRYERLKIKLQEGEVINCRLYIYAVFHCRIYNFQTPNVVDL